MCFKRIGLLFFNIFLICLNDLDIFFFYKIEINFFFLFFYRKKYKRIIYGDFMYMCFSDF